MGLGLWGMTIWLSGWFAPANGIVVQVTALVALIISGIIIYAVMAHVTGALRLSELRQVLKRG
jgi:hypothetical protein